MSEATTGFTPTDEDVAAPAAAIESKWEAWGSWEDCAYAALATIGPIIERERAAERAKVDAEYEAAGFPPTDEDVDRAACAAWGPRPPDWSIIRNRYPDTAAKAREEVRRTLATIGPIIERERRAAKVEALREAAGHRCQHGTNCVGGDAMDSRADEIERGE